TLLKQVIALSFWPSRAYRSPTVFETVRSFGSAFRTFSYSEMAFCSFPCWTNFSAELRTFCLLNPKPNAISFSDSRSVRFAALLELTVNCRAVAGASLGRPFGHGHGTAGQPNSYG